MGYHRAGFEVVGVDIKPQPHYPFEFYQDDALDWLDALPYDFPKGYDAIHASPPCQQWTAYARRPAHVGEYPDLIGATRDLLQDIGLPWVIENVIRAPLNKDALQLCGSSFGLDVQRHRRFETSIPMLPPPCDHGWQTPRFAQATNRSNLRKTVEIGVWRIPLIEQKRAMGVDWDVTLEELSEMIPPAYTEWIGRQLLQVIERGRDAA